MNNKRHLLLAFFLTSLFLVAVHLYLGRQRWATASRHGYWERPGQEAGRANAAADGHILMASTITLFIEAIMSMSSSALPKLHCPAINTTRYDGLASTGSPPTLDYFFALNLRQTLPVLPLLIGSIVETIKYLGPKRCALSIVEGHSPDGTADVLAALKPALESKEARTAAKYGFGAGSGDFQQVKLTCKHNRCIPQRRGGCEQGEPQLFCKDSWFNRYRKIAVVPSVNLEYSVEKGEMIKEAKGYYTSDTVSNQDPAKDQIQWRLDPPEKVKCMPSWGNQFWQSWSETLGR